MHHGERRDGIRPDDAAPRRGSARSPRRRCATRRCRSSPFPSWCVLRRHRRGSWRQRFAVLLCRSWKMWPTSMPRQSSSVAVAVGLGSPATTLRRSATSAGSGRSRPSSRRSGGSPSSLAPHTKSASAAALRSAMTGMPMVRRADVAGLAAERGDDLGFGGQAEADRADDLLRLDLVQVMIAAQQQQAKRRRSSSSSDSRARDRLDVLRPAAGR
jgi:hypothetical protein